MKIVSYMPAERQTIMFSATLPPKIRELAKTILRNPAEVNIAISKPNEAIDQSAYVCYENQKLGIIRELFAEPTDSKTIIFSSSKLKVKELAHTLKRMKLDVAAMHSDLEQAQREEVMLDFKNNKVKILVATDIVARGIDIEDIGLVLNYDVPHDPEDYIHRIGRTARAAAIGRCRDVRQRGGAGQVPPDREIHRAGHPQGRTARRAWAKARNTLPTKTAAASAAAARAAAAGIGTRTVPARGRGRGDDGGGRRSSQGRWRSQPRSPRRQRACGCGAGAKTAAGTTQASPADSDHASGRGEGNRGTRDRKRHRGGRNRNRNRGGNPQEGGATPPAN